VKVRITLGVLGSLLGLAMLLLYLARQGVLSGAQAGLMFIALLGMYVGFGTLILVYRLINRLD